MNREFLKRVSLALVMVMAHNASFAAYAADLNGGQIERTITDWAAFESQLATEARERFESLSEKEQKEALRKVHLAAAEIKAELDVIAFQSALGQIAPAQADQQARSQVFKIMNRQLKRQPLDEEQKEQMREVYATRLESKGLVEISDEIEKAVSSSAYDGLFDFLGDPFFWLIFIVFLPVIIIVLIFQNVACLFTSKAC